jgi:hypothetical protein
LISQKELYPGKWYRALLYLPFVLALGGIGLTLTNARAVMEALFGIKSPFKRTPKYRVEKRGEKSQAAKYRKRLGLLPVVELLISAYFALTIWYAIANANYLTIPFLFLFMFGYGYTAVLSVTQGMFDRFRAGVANPDESSPRPFPVGV